jgi:hypothetical protein
LPNDSSVFYFRTKPTYTTDNALETDSVIAVNDGSYWMIEVFKDKKFHMVVRWAPSEKTAFRTIGEYLISISQIKGETGGFDFY